MKMTSEHHITLSEQKGCDTMEERAKGVIKCYFVLNKGRWISAKEISEFLQGNDFKLGKLGKGLSSAKVSNLLKKNYFRDLEVKKQTNNSKLYRYN